MPQKKPSKPDPPVRTLAVLLEENRRLEQRGRELMEQAKALASQVTEARARSENGRCRAELTPAAQSAENDECALAPPPPLFPPRAGLEGTPAANQIWRLACTPTHHLPFYDRTCESIPNHQWSFVG